VGGISYAAEHLGFRTIAVKLAFDNTEDSPALIEFPTPFIVNWNQAHFVVVYKITASQV